MKNKIHKILGIGLTLVLALALVGGFALPAGAAVEKLNEWYNFEYPVGGELGDWFMQGPTTADNILGIGPMARAINDDLYAYTRLQGSSPDIHRLFKSTDGARSWAATAYELIDLDPTTTVINPPGAIKDMVCSPIDEDIIYVTDGDYVYKSSDGGDTWLILGRDSLEKVLMCACGIRITGIPITCLDVGYGPDDAPYVFIGVSRTCGDPSICPSGGAPSVLYINEEGFPAAWTDLELQCYGGGGYFPYSVGVAPDFADSKKAFAVVSGMASLGESGDAAALWSDTQAHNGGESAHLITTGSVGTGDEARVVITMPSGTTLGDITGISWWVFAVAGYPPHLDITLDTVDPDQSMLTAEPEYNNAHGQGAPYNYNTWLETFELTSGDGYGEIGDTTMLWVTKMGAGNTDAPYGTLAQWKAGTVGNDPGSELPTTEINSNTLVTKLEIEVDNWVHQPSEAYVDDITINGVTYGLDAETHVISTVGVSCSWSEVSELLQNCDTANPFRIQEASRIAFPDDYEDTETLFVGVTGSELEFGGDVYMATVTTPVSAAIDMNVAGIWSGCVGKVPATNIISLDIYGDTDGACLIAGVYGYVDSRKPHLFNEGTDVYCSEDGGWSWDVSTKDPTGGYWDAGKKAFQNGRVEALWYDGMGLAATEGCECAVSMCCGEDYPCEFFSQISLIATDITCVVWGDHSPEYLSDDSSTMYMLTTCPGCCGGTESLFRHDGTYWERVFCSTISGADGDPAFEMVEVSPDFDATSAVYLFNHRLEGWRTTDAGCSWDKITFPCAPRPFVSAGVVVDEDTVIAGGSGTDDGWIFKTTRHGARPWKAYEMSTTIPKGDAVSFDLEPGYEDPGYVLYGDDNGRVWLSEDGGETWELVGSGALAGCVAVLGTDDVWVVFDPGFNTAGDDGEDTIYAAAGDNIARCTIDWDEDIIDQEWVWIGGDTGDDYLGIETKGDTALYVTNAACEVTAGLRTVTVSGQVSAEWTGQDWYAYDWGYFFEALQMPLVGTIDLIDREIKHEQGLFNDDELVVHISDVLTTTGYNRMHAISFEDIDYGDSAWFWDEGDGLSGKVFVPPDVVVEVGTWDSTYGFVASALGGSYNEITGYFTLADYVSGSYVYPTLHFEGIGINGFAYVFVPITEWDWDYGKNGAYAEDIMGFPFPACSGTIGVEGSYTGATGDIELVNETVWLPPNVWSIVLENWDMWDMDDFLEWWLTGVVREVNSTNLISDVTGAVAPEEVISCVLRSLNPLDDVKPTMKVVFERLTDGLAGECLYGLAVTHDVSEEGCDENVLWTLESAPECFNVWVYEDTTAQPVIAVAPLDGRKLGVTDEVTLEWEELCGVECYEVSLFKYCATCPEEKRLVPIADLCPELVPVCTTAETCIVIEDLEAGTTYYWQVRACKGHPTLSKWSVERTFLTALGIPEVISPACGADSIIISPSFNWTAVTGADSYDIELATTETFTTGVIRGSSTVNAWVIAEPLDYATTYYWRVRAQADDVYSDWVVSIFTTAAKAVPAPPPVVVEPTPPAPVVPAPIIEFPPTPGWVWAIIGIGAALAVVVIVLIVRTRRPPA